MRRLRRLHEILGRPKEIVAGLLILAVVASATGIFASPHHPRAREAASEAGGGGAFVPATVPPTTTTSTAPPTTTTTPPPPPTTQPAPPTTAPPATTRSAAPSPPPPAPPAHGPTPSAALGVYTGAANPAGAASFAAATGAHVTVVEDYLPGSGSWSGIDGAGGSLDWMFGAWQGSGYQLVLGVPMFDDSDHPPTRWRQEPPVPTTRTS